MSNNNQTIAPFIQWVGGKRNLAKILSSYIPHGLSNYYEPFLGGGALFFNVHDKFQRCFLSDEPVARYEFDEFWPVGKQALSAWHHTISFYNF